MKKRHPTNSAIAKDLLKLSREMRRIGVQMEYYGGFGKMGQRGRELIGAARMAKGWGAAIRKLK